MQYAISIIYKLCACDNVKFDINSQISSNNMTYNYFIVCKQLGLCKLCIKNHKKLTVL